MPILGSSNLAANKDVDVNRKDKWGYIYLIEKKTLWETLRVISPFPTMFSKAVCC